MADRRIRAILEAQDRASPAFRKLGTNVQSLQATVSKVTSAILGAGGLAVAFRTVAQLAERAGELTNLSTAFATLNERIDAQARTFLPRLRSATLGVVADLDLMRLSNNAVVLGVAESEKQFSELAEVAVKLGRAVGVDAVRSVESLVTGLGRQSALMLDNLGIVVKADEAYQKYAASLGTTADNLTAAQRKQAFMNDAIAAAKEKADGLTPAVDTLSDGYQRLSVSIGNATGRFLDWVNVSLGTELATNITKVQLALDALNLVKFPTKEVRGLSKELSELVKISTGLSGVSPTDISRLISGDAPELKAFLETVREIRRSIAAEESRLQDAGFMKILAEQIFTANQQAEMLRNTLAQITEPIPEEGALGVLGAIGELPTLIGTIEPPLKKVQEQVISLGQDIRNALGRVGVTSALAFGDTLVDAALGAEVSFKSFFKSLLRDLLAAIARALILRTILSFFGPVGQVVGGAVAGAVVGASGGSGGPKNLALPLDKVLAGDGGLVVQVEMGPNLSALADELNVRVRQGTTRLVASEIVTSRSAR